MTRCLKTNIFRKYFLEILHLLNFMKYYFLYLVINGSGSHDEADASPTLEFGLLFTRERKCNKGGLVVSQPRNLTWFTQTTGQDMLSPMCHGLCPPQHPPCLFPCPNPFPLVIFFFRTQTVEVLTTNMLLRIRVVLDSRL